LRLHADVVTIADMPSEIWEEVDWLSHPRSSHADHMLFRLVCQFSTAQMETSQVLGKYRGGEKRHQQE
jgi:hypothetical protein